MIGGTQHVDLSLRCDGCATVVDPLDGAAATKPTVSGSAPAHIGRCPMAERAPDIDHVLVWDPVTAGIVEWPDGPELHPFVRYRTLQHWYWLGRARGLSDEAMLSLVDRLDRSVAGVAGSGFRITPFDRDDRASDRLGLDIWAKDETGNVGGSHKARHLFGLLAHLEIQRMSARTRLAIASCGNAALAAAILARAVRRPIEVFVPETANQIMIERLGALGASVTTCRRDGQTRAGDPCVHRFRAARDGGAFAFCCQGTEQGLTIDGGSTLGYELATQLSLIGMADVPVCVPVGGGALGASVAAGLGVARRLGILDGAPRLHFVQAEGCAPLHRAWRRVAERALAASGVSGDDAADASDFEAATLLVDPERSDAVRGALGWAATHRSRHMWPWDEPSSVATGIIDDETYDWFALVRAMLETGGWPLVVTERQLERANELAGVQSDHTGSAALAGALALGVPSGAKVVVLYTGTRR